MHRVLIAVMSALALVLTSLTSLGDVSPASAETSTAQVHRITGYDSVAVVAETSKHYPPGQAVTFIVAAGAHADGMVTATRAGGINAPVLLVRGDSIPAATATALDRLDSRRIVVVGGDQVVPEAVRNSLTRYASSGVVERVSGANRYATAVKMSQKYAAGVERVYVAGGNGVADANAGAALAGHQGVPMLLTRRDRLGSSVARELQRLQPKEIVVLGGTAVVSDGVRSELRKYAVSGTVRRIAGADRYATAAQIAGQMPPGASTVYAASGEEYADSMVGAALAARTGRPLVLIKSTSVPSATKNAITAHQPQTIYALGHRHAVTDAVIEELRLIINPQTTPPPAPTPGSALLGGYLGAPYEMPDERFREAFGAWPDLASTYYQAKGRNGGTINRAYESARVQRGTIPVLTVTSVNGPYTMQQIGSGAADSWIDYWATELAALKGEVWFTFDHEFEVKLNQGKWSPAPSLNDYVKAYNRFQQRVKAKAPNVKFLYWYGYSDKGKIDPIGAGINRPDIISLDPYVFSHHSPTTTFEAMAQPKLDWLRSRSWYDGQPIVFTEFAKDTVHGESNVVDFLTNLRPHMDSLGVSGAVYFSRNKSGDIMADLTTSQWPRAREAFARSVNQ